MSRPADVNPVFCRACGYSLRGLPADRCCPECGSLERFAPHVSPRRLAVRYLAGFGALLALWGSLVGWGWPEAATLLCHRSRIAVAHVDELTPDAKGYANVRVSTKVLAQVRSSILPEWVTTSYELQFTPNRESGGTAGLLSGARLESVSDEDVLQMIRRAAPASPEATLRIEASALAALIRYRCTYQYYAQAGPPESWAEPPHFHVRDLPFGGSFGAQRSISISDQGPPSIVLHLGWLIFAAGAIALAMRFRRRYRRSMRFVRGE